MARLARQLNLLDSRCFEFESLKIEPSPSSYLTNVFFLQGVEPLPAAALATSRSERPTCSCFATRSQTQPRSSLLSTSGAPRSDQSLRMLRSSSSDARVISARIVTSSPVWQSPAGLRSRLTRLCPSAARSLPSSTSRPARRRRHVRPFPLLRLPDLLRWEK